MFGVLCWLIGSMAVRQRESYTRLGISGIVVQSIRNFVEYVGVNMGIPVPLLLIDMIMSACSRTRRVTHLTLRCS